MKQEFSLPPTLLRLSVGIEDAEDLWADLGRALCSPAAGRWLPARLRAAIQDRCAGGVLMYVPRHFEEPRPEQLQALISENPLGVLVTHGAEGLNANHLPFELELREGSSGIPWRIGE